MGREFGINVIGYIDGEFGLGEAVRLNIKALQKVNVPVSIANYKVRTAHRHSDSTFTIFSEEFPYSVNLIQISPAEVPNFLLYIDSEKLKDRYNILYVAWESEYVPDEYVKNMSFFDEIWVPSKYCQDIISRVCRVPVISIPHPVEVVTTESIDPDTLNFYDKSKFNFFFMFDYNSAAIRKNIYTLIEAFEMAFGKNNSDVVLHIKTSLSARFAEEKVVLLSKIAGFSNIIITEKIFDKGDLHFIIKNCDCYVSLHRSEGFGLTMAEAMYFGKPVIATGYSGNLEFMNFHNSFLVNYKMTVAGNDLHNYGKNTIWSEPDVEDAARLLKEVAENREKAAVVGQIGRESVREKLSFTRIGNLMKQRLLFVSKTNYSDSSRNQLIALQTSYGKLIIELTKIKKSNLIMLILKAKAKFRALKSKKK